MLSEGKRGIGHMRADFFGVSNERDQIANDFFSPPDLVKRDHIMKAWFLWVAFCIYFEETYNLKCVSEPQPSMHYKLLFLQIMWNSDIFFQEFLGQYNTSANRQQFAGPDQRLFYFPPAFAVPSCLPIHSTVRHTNTHKLYLVEKKKKKTETTVTFQNTEDLMQGICYNGLGWLKEEKLSSEVAQAGSSY